MHIKQKCLAHNLYLRIWSSRGKILAEYHQQVNRRSQTHTVAETKSEVPGELYGNLGLCVTLCLWIRSQTYGGEPRGTAAQRGQH